MFRKGNKEYWTNKCYLNRKTLKNKSKFYNENN